MASFTSIFHKHHASKKFFLKKKLYVQTVGKKILNNQKPCKHQHFTSLHFFHFPTSTIKTKWRNNTETEMNAAWNKKKTSNLVIWYVKMATTSNFHILLNPITAHHNNVFYFHCNKTHSFYIWRDRSMVLKTLFFGKKSGFRSMSYHQHIVFGCETPNLASTNDSYTYKRNDKITQFMRCRLFLPYMRPNY